MAGLLMASWRDARRPRAAEREAVRSRKPLPPSRKTAASQSSLWIPFSSSTNLMLEVGLGLVPLVDSKQGGQLLCGKVRALRKHLAQQLGFLVPSIHITDNLTLKEREYVIYLRGVEIARWEMRRDCLLAISSGAHAAALARTGHP